MSRDFDGVDDSVDFGDTALLNGITALSCVGWLFIDALPTNNNNISVVRKDIQFTFIQVNSSAAMGGNGILTSFWNTAGVIKTQRVPVGFSTNKWYRYATRWSASENSGVPQYSLDGSKFANYTSGGALLPSLTTGGTVALRFGATETNTEDYNGRLSSVQYFTSYLTDGEVAQAFAAPGSVQRNLLAFWRLQGSPVEPNWTLQQLPGTVSGSTVSPVDPPVSHLFTISSPGHVV